MGSWGQTQVLKQVRSSGFKCSKCSDHSTRWKHSWHSDLTLLAGCFLLDYVYDSHLFDHIINLPQLNQSHPNCFSRLHFGAVLFPLCVSFVGLRLLHLFHLCTQALDSPAFFSITSMQALIPYNLFFLSVNVFLILGYFFIWPFK